MSIICTILCTVGFTGAGSCSAQGLGLLYSWHTQCSWKTEQLEKVGLTYKTFKYSGKSEERMVSVMHQYRICEEVSFIGSWELIWKCPQWFLPWTCQTVPSGLFLDMLWFGSIIFGPPDAWVPITKTKCGRHSAAWHWGIDKEYCYWQLAELSFVSLLSVL